MFRIGFKHVTKCPHHIIGAIIVFAARDIGREDEMADSYPGNTYEAYSFLRISRFFLRISCGSPRNSEALYRGAWHVWWELEQNIGKSMGFVKSLFACIGLFYGKFTEIIGLKVAGNYSASI